MPGKKIIWSVLGGLVAVSAIVEVAGSLGGHSAAWQPRYDFGYNMNQDDDEAGIGSLSSSKAQQFCSGEPGLGTKAAMPGKYGMQAPPASNSPGVSDWVAGCVAGMSGAGG